MAAKKIRRQMFLCVTFDEEEDGDGAMYSEASFRFKLTNVIGKYIEGAWISRVEIVMMNDQGTSTE